MAAGGCGGPFTTIATLNGFAGVQSGSGRYDISAYRSATACVRFQINDGEYTAATDYIYLDDVKIEAWQYDTFRDEFTAVAYNNWYGNVNWSSQSWIETNDDGAAGTGDILITGGELRLNNYNTQAVFPSIERQADLSGYPSAEPSFNLRATGVEAGDIVAVEVSNDGGGTYTEVERFEGALAAQSRSYDISRYRATNTRVRFRVISGYTGTGGGGAANEFFYGG